MATLKINDPYMYTYIYIHIFSHRSIKIHLEGERKSRMVVLLLSIIAIGRERVGNRRFATLPIGVYQSWETTSPNQYSNWARLFRPLIALLDRVEFASTIVKHAFIALSRRRRFAFVSNHLFLAFSFALFHSFPSFSHLRKYTFFQPPAITA